MRLQAHAHSGRFLAVLLSLSVLALLYLFGIHWVFIEPQLELYRQMSDLREQQARFRQTAEQRTQIEKRLTEVRAFEQNNQAFLPAADANSAFSDLNQRIKQVVTTHDVDAKRCKINGVNQSARPGAADEAYQRVSIQVNLQCDLETLSLVLYDLENGNPYLFIDQLMIYKQQVYRGRYVTPGSKKPQPTQSYLNINFTLSGYLRQPTNQPVKKTKP